MSDKEVARLFLSAFERDNIDTWIAALKAEEGHPVTGELGKAVAKLRSCWWHDGSPEKRRAVHEAAAALKFELSEAK